MDDLVGSVMRSLPDTDKSRYDIAYQRGRAQARSSMLFGGLGLGLAGGVLAMFLLDPQQGGDRRAALVRAAGDRLTALRGTAAARIGQLRDRERPVESGTTRTAVAGPVAGTRVLDASATATADRPIPRTPARSAAARDAWASDPAAVTAGLDRERVGAATPER